MINKLSEDIVKARKSGEKERVMQLSYIKSLLIEESKSKTPKKPIEVLKAYRKQLLKSMEDFEGNEIKCREIYEEIQIVKQYIPEEMSEESIRFIVENVVSVLEKPTMKDIMKEVAPQTKGKADSELVLRIVKEYL